MAENAPVAVKAESRGLNIALWIAQVLLAAAFLMSGGIKFVMSADQLAQAHMSPLLVRFIGLCEVAGALGVLLPAATRVRPMLTPLAALGLLVIMVLAFALHLSRGEMNHLPPPLVLGALAAFVAWGRFRKLPIAPR